MISIIRKKLRARVVCIVILASLALTLSLLLPLHVVAAQGQTGGGSYVSDLPLVEDLKQHYPRFFAENPDLLATCHIPHLALDSPDAQAYNAEMQGYADAIDQSFAGEYPPTVYVDYDVYRYEEYLSIYFVFSLWGEGNTYFEKANCFDLRTGALLSNEDILAEIGYPDLDVVRLAEDSLFYHNRVHHVFHSDLDNMQKMMLGLSLDSLWLQQRPTNLYFDDEGRHMLLQPIFVPAGSGEGYTQMEALQPLLSQPMPLNSLYLDIARELDAFDPYADSAPLALVAYVGEWGYRSDGSVNYDSFDAVFGKVSTLHASFGRYHVPSLFFNAVYDEDLGTTVLNGTGFFLVVPRYERKVMGFSYPNPEMMGEDVLPSNYTLDTAGLFLYELGNPEADVSCYLRDRFNIYSFTLAADETGAFYDLPAEIYDFTAALPLGEDNPYPRVGPYYDAYSDTLFAYLSE